MSEEAGVSERLLSWYRAFHRDLPWRRTRDPYAIWVSEIMLQQTQVATVIPYYERFLARFPTVAALAEAPVDEVLRLWAGLGYYSRARNLQSGAQEVVSRHGGSVPEAIEELLALPGVGRYTAGAIASIAHNRPVPILDGNVIRVLCRIYALRGDPKRAPLHARLWQLAEEVIPEGHAGEFNQALMELGATVCTPTSPRCDVCPVAGLCEARRLGIQESLPELARSAPPTPLRMAAAVVWRGTEVLLVKRPSNCGLRIADCGLADNVKGRPVGAGASVPIPQSAIRNPQSEGWWAGMWQFPSGVVQPDESTAAAAARFARETTGLEVTPGAVAGVVRHGVTRWKITLEARHCLPRDHELEPYGCADWCWTPLDATDRFALPAPQRRLVEQIRRQTADGRWQTQGQIPLLDI
jgi:A/G-specific adenine glycosylase